MDTFSALLDICVVYSPHKGQWRRALVFSLICAWLNGWAINGEAGDLRCHRSHYDVIVMISHEISYGFSCWRVTTRVPDQDITWTSVDLAPVRCHGIHLRALSWRYQSIKRDWIFKIASIPQGPMGHNTDQATIAQRRHDVKLTSSLRQNDVATSFWRIDDVIFASCDRWEAAIHT